MDRECGKKKKGNGVSVGVRGPVSIHQAVSVSPVEIESMQITKSVNGEVELNEDSTEKDSKKSSDTMGMKHFVRFGLYQIKGSVNVQLAEKTGFTQEDVAVSKSEEKLPESVEDYTIMVDELPGLAMEEIVGV